LPYLFDVPEHIGSLKQVLEEAHLKDYEFIERLEYANGGVYRGCLLKQLRHGPGVQEWPNSRKIEGESEKDIPDKIKYEGEWKNDK